MPCKASSRAARGRPERLAPPFATALLLSLAAHPVGAAPFPAELDLRSLGEDELRPIVDASLSRVGAVALGDVDGDGFDDLAGWESVRFVDGQTLSDGFVLLFGSEGHDRTVLERASLVENDALLVEGMARSGRTPAIDDIDGDGRADWFHDEGDLGIAPAGDIDGDGLADWRVFAFDIGYGVVFGRTGRYPSPLDVRSLGEGEVVWFSDGVEATADGVAFWRPLPAGDFDGDGIDDLLFHTDGNEPDPELDGTYRLKLFRGRRGGIPRQVSLGELVGSSSAEVRFTSCDRTPAGCATDPYRFDHGVAAAGDLDGDGLDDIAITAAEWHATFREGFVVFGNAAGLPPLVAPSTLDGTTGFTFTGPTRYAFTSEIGFSRDVNGDGVDDLLVDVGNGTSHVLYGRTGGFASAVDLALLTETEGYTVTGASRSDPGPTPLGDLDGDGLGDWLAGSHVVYGTSTARAALDLDELDGLDGFTWRRGYEAFAVGDVNGDGPDDLLMTDPDTDGVSRLVFGRDADQAPASPSGIRASLAADAIAVHWGRSPDEDVRGYRVRRDGRTLADVGVDATHHDDVDIERDREYRYEVAAVDGAGEESSTLLIAVTHDRDEFPDLLGDVYSDSLAELFFYSDTYLTPLTIVFRDGVPLDQSTRQSYLDAAYTPDGHDYFIEQWIGGPFPYPASARTGLWARSPTLRLPRSEPGRPTPPLDASFELYAESTLELFWDAPVNGAGPFAYEIARDDVVAGTAEGPSFVDDRLPATDDLLRYAIVAIDRNGKRSNPLTYEVSLHGARLASRVAPPTALRSAAYSPTAAELFWSRSDTGVPAVGFEVFRDGTPVGTTPGTSLLDPGLSPNAVYRYDVRGFAADGRRSEARSLTVRSIGPPPTPEGFRVEVYSSRVAELLWQRQPPFATRVHHYVIERDGVAVATSVDTSWLDDTLSPGTSYRYRLIAVSPEGYESAADPIAVTTPGAG